MTNEELISKIKAEIERLKEEAYNSILPDEPKYRTHYKVGKKELCEELLSFLSTLESEKPIPNDLEEAAKKYAKAYTDNDNGNGGDDWEDDIKLTFIAGAKWQADHTPLPEDTVLFNKGVEEGKRQMIQEAVEAHIYQSANPVSEIGHQLHQAALLYEDKENAPYLKAGDKVRIIIVKEDEK